MLKNTGAHSVFQNLSLKTKAKKLEQQLDEVHQEVVDVQTAKSIAQDHSKGGWRYSGTAQRCNRLVAIHWTECAVLCLTAALRGYPGLCSDRGDGCQVGVFAQ